MIRPPNAWNFFAYLSLLVFAASMTWDKLAQLPFVESCSMQVPPSLAVPR